MKKVDADVMKFVVIPNLLSVAMCEDGKVLGIGTAYLNVNPQNITAISKIKNSGEFAEKTLL